MSTRLTTLVTRLVLAALVLTGLSFTTPAAAATTAPVWEPDTNSVGTLSFFDATGKVVTSGNDLSHLFDYAVASSAAQRPTNKATLYFGFPDKSKPDTSDWFSSIESTPAKFPDPAAPAPLDGFGSRPVAHAAINEANLEARLSSTTLDTNDGYRDIVQIRLRDSGPGNPAEDVFWSGDISYNRAANSWTQVFPTVASGAATTTSLAVSPASPQSPGTAVTLTATVSPAGAAGAVQFADGATAIGSAVPVSGGVARRTTSTLTSGTHSLTATFVPTDSSAYAGSSSTASTYVVSATASALTIVAPTTVKYNAAARVSTVLTDATTKKAIGSGPVSLYRRAKSTSAWALAKTVTSSSTGAAAVSLTVLANAQFQWRYAGTGSHAAVVSATKSVAVSQTITAARTPSTAKRGGTVKVYGTVAPTGTGQTVALQRVVGGKWTTQKGAVTIKRQKLPNGRTVTGFVFGLKLNTPGSYSYRVYKAATTALAAGYSSSLPIRVT